MTTAALSVEETVLARLREIPDFPQPGVLFRDFTPLLRDGAALRTVVDDVAERYRGRVDAVIGLESRGFIIGSAVAYTLGVGFVPVRKQGKLPAARVSAEYDLEYGRATAEMHVDALVGAHRVVIVDDVLATGGTAAAACSLVEQVGGEVVAVDVLMEISALGGRRSLENYEVHTIVSL
ncbi:adenine phosphoribosyltransferase [Austwickia chelonae]|uniref:Adenine phosphoribosyltransferase n=1 Tax=Austwickia chelonae NBRC 105200 TaxID=1184607 RepID=K6ULS5_9MICO|nr:adenine phosphoribosyltransferase [Austwickia chelonae]GAB77496.1 adenine phosphoribosyltransferase [Austwickia chelonae NBRC 105200]SEW11532.1 adenine phosphoribosyltransferase [Austwickia chelonae]